MTAADEPNVDPSTDSGQAELAQRLQAAIGDGYVVEKPLGAGGFAVVYLVRDLSLKRSLAVKVLSPDLITSKTVLERFRREAETVAQLSHPNIVPLHFIGQKDDLLYLAMACIDGGSVADRVEKSGPLSVPDATRVIMEVASALAHAHKRGVIHRDIKPQNVLTDSDSGRSLVTDFGIARTSDSSLTSTGMFVGTPTYLSPEQVTGEPSDHRADIYALGVMAYEILAGKAPFDGPTPTAILMKRLAGPPEPITTIRKDVPEELANVIDACLAPDPEQRFQSAADIVAVLGGDPTRTPTLPGGKTVKRPAATSIWTRLWPVIALVILVGGLAVTYATMKARGKRPAATNATLVSDVTMADIPAGDYPIGTNTGDSLARPAHTVTLPAFSIGKTEVTVSDYAKYIAADSQQAPWTGAPPQPQLPVTGVLLQEAANYCKWKYPNGGRLPTEEEWEAAARGKAGRDYPWGMTFDASAANTSSAGRGVPEAVGSSPRGATPEGVQDLIGNVWEWTSTRMQPYPGIGAPTLSGAMTQYWVIRGGAFNTGDAKAAAWVRGYFPPTAERKALAGTGFRCARTQ